MEGEQSWSCCEWCLSPSTVKDTLSSHSTNPQNLGEKIIHTCIYQSKYWKKESFGRAGAGCRNSTFCKELSNPALC
uniref:Uncharacterized protein n=1 Tax=Zosterops lateralis melanops TaxID=1220523 RepID=A0A8D2QQA2_ZOSLA